MNEEDQSPLAVDGGFTSIINALSSRLYDRLGCRSGGYTNPRARWGCYLGWITEGETEGILRNSLNVRWKVCIVGVNLQVLLVRRPHEVALR